MAAVGSATGNLWLAGIAALPAAILASSETIGSQLHTLKNGEEYWLRLEPPIWWQSDSREWQDLCTEIQEAMPSLLQEMGLRLQRYEGVVTSDVIREAFIAALVTHHLTWAHTQAERQQIGEEITTPILAALEQALNPLIKQIQQETFLKDTHTTAGAATKILSVLETIQEDNSKEPNQSELEHLQSRYFASLREQYEFMDLGGISPRVTSKAESKVVSIRMEDVFIPLEARPSNGDLQIVDEVHRFEEVEMPESQETLTEEDKKENLEGVDDGPRRATQKARSQAGIRSRTAKHRNEDTVDMTTILRYRKAVILGHPGAGKSTLAKYAAYTLARGKGALIGKHMANTMPLLVKAADYGKQLKKDESLSFFRYVTGTQHTDEYGPLFRWALQNNRCLVLIDGLDEVPDPVLRVRVATRIEQFVSDYPQNQFLITSRIVGYRENQLTGNFIHFQLADWEPEQITAFLEQWYLAVTGRNTVANKAECKRRAKALWEAIKKNEGVKKLAGTPLLLTIIALVNYYGNKLPERRVELYQLATDTLLSNWPLKQRGQQFDLREVLALLEPIAHRIFTTSPDRLITEYEFRPLFEGQIHILRDTNARQTRSISSQLLNKIEEHTGFFLSRGVNENGQQVYGFLHPTFAEYLTARYLAYRWLETRQLEFADQIHESAWHEVVLLMAGHLGTMADVLATQLIEYIEQLSSPYEPFLHRDLLLVAEILGEKVPVSREKVNAIVDQLISWALETPYEELWEAIRERLADIAQSFPFANQPKQLKPSGDDPVSVRVRKVVLSKTIGFQIEGDLGMLWEGLTGDEMTASMAEQIIKEIGGRSGKHYLLALSSNELMFVRPTLDKVAERVRKLGLPVMEVDNLNEPIIAPQKGSRQPWLLDLQKLPMMAEIFSEVKDNNPEGSWRKRYMLQEMLENSNANLLKTTLLDWINQVASQRSGGEYSQALSGLDNLPDIWGIYEGEKLFVRLTGVKEALQQLLPSCDDPNDRAKVLRVLVWGTQGLPDWSEMVCQGLSDTTKEVRIAITRMVGKIEYVGRRIPEQVLEKFRELLKETDLDLVKATRTSMIRSGIYEELDIPLLLEGISDPDKQAGIFSIGASIEEVGRLGRKTHKPKVIEDICTHFEISLARNVFYEDSHLIVTSFSGWRDLPSGSFAKRLCETLTPLFHNSDPQIRRRAVIVWRFLQPEQLGQLLDMLKDDNAMVREAAIIAFYGSDFSGIELTDSLVNAVNSDSLPVRKVALRILANYQDVSAKVVEACLEIVKQNLKDDTSINPLSNYVIRVLARIKDPELRKTIIDTAFLLVAEGKENIYSYPILWKLL